MDQKMDEAWVQLRHDVCSLLSVADFSTITFVKSTKRQSMDPDVFREEINLKVPVLHPDGRPVSICTRYLQWATDGAVLDPHLIDIWRHGADLYLFMRENINDGGESLLAADFVSSPIVRIPFPTRSEWYNASRQDFEKQGYTPDEIRNILTDDEYARSIRNQVQTKYPDLKPVLRFSEYKSTRGKAIEGFERYDALEMYKEYLRNLIRRDIKTQDESKSKFWKGVRARRLKREMDAALEAPEPKRRAHPSAAAELGPLPTTAEGWAAELNVIPPDLRNIFFEQARERTVHELGLLDSDDSFIHTQGRRRDNSRFSVVMEGRDTFSTFKQKVSNATGIPVESLGLAWGGSWATELGQLFSRPREVQFSALDKLGQERRREELHNRQP
jgi:hypothetical protein